MLCVYQSPPGCVWHATNNITKPLVLSFQSVLFSRDETTHALFTYPWRDGCTRDSETPTWSVPASLCVLRTVVWKNFNKSGQARVITRQESINPPFHKNIRVWRAWCG